jgi:flagellar protein FlbD
MTMLELTKIDGAKILVNAEEIETVESNFDTVINFKSSKKLIVKESQQEIQKLFIEYKQKCNGIFLDK